MFVVAKSVIRLTLCVLVVPLCYSSEVLGQELTIEEISVHREERIDPVEAGRQYWLQLAEGMMSSTQDFTIPSELLDGKDSSDIKWGVSPYPKMLYQVLPVTWKATLDFPVLNFLHEFPEYVSDRQIQMLDLLSIFNIEVIVPGHFRFNYPENATLVFELYTDSKAISVNVPMELAGTLGTYAIVDPDELVFRLMREIEEFQLGTTNYQLIRPEMSLEALTGFDFNENTVSNFRFTGIPVAYNVKFGSVVVHNGFQWAGQPTALPLRYPQRPFLTK